MGDAYGGCPSDPAPYACFIGACDFAYSIVRGVRTPLQLGSSTTTLARRGLIFDKRGYGVWGVLHLMGKTGAGEGEEASCVWNKDIFTCCSRSIARRSDVFVVL